MELRYALEQALREEAHAEIAHFEDIGDDHNFIYDGHVDLDRLSKRIKYLLENS